MKQKTVSIVLSNPIRKEFYGGFPQLAPFSLHRNKKNIFGLLQANSKGEESNLFGWGFTGDARSIRYSATVISSQNL